MREDARLAPPQQKAGASPQVRPVIFILFPALAPYDRGKKVKMKVIPRQPSSKAELIHHLTFQNQTFG
jgi:hypothetical protein